jgi:hypothetical protein
MGLIMGKARIYLTASALWVALLAIAFVVGALREGLLTPRLGEPSAHVVGTLVAVALMAMVISAYVRRIHASCSTADLLRIGALWLALTVGFEFGFFHSVLGTPWAVLLADYDLLRGRVWVLVLATVLLGPIVVGTALRRRTAGRQRATPGA